MISRRVLNELLQKPLGPYHDHHVLDPEECQTTAHRELVLYSFMLEHNGQVIGLDESERPLNGQGEDNRKFRFRGVLKIANPSWLSDFGLKTVESELNLRADERALREGERRGQQLTLEGLFKSKLLRKSNFAWDDETEEEETKLTILIQGEKSLAAVFMQNTRVPTGLLWSSKDCFRKYQIATMDVATYSRSQNYFWRWKLLALMEKIVKKYDRVPIERRTPDWFVKKYFADYASPEEDIHRRLIFDDGDHDVDEDGNTQTPRQLLRPHRSEILGLFASQAEWFVTNGQVRSKKLFDFKSWDKFWQRVQKERRDAAKEGVSWGWPVGHERSRPEDLSSSTESGEGVEEEDELEELVRRNPVTGKSNKVVARKLELARKKKRGGPRRLIESSSDGSASEEDDPATARAYASDFSESSEEEAPYSDGVDEDILNNIPWELQHVPRVPDADGRWWCPVRGCGYLIDLRNLNEENRRGVSGELIAYITHGDWRNVHQDRAVLRGFGSMVVKHYSQHFVDRGIKCSIRGGRAQIEWEHGRRSADRVHNGYARGPLAPPGSLRGESRVITTVHAYGGAA
ncbi:hypothetical protein HYDPIDRAFT_106640 [Hydnomerulius pinastri MD-312]|nr:hypothetical protein HYDPIDRAFT_106640 [Hydnomerulius pinastri MD-312]